jgi:hypothetical protein
MGDAINYLKLDLRISKRTLRLIIPALIFMSYMFLEQKAYISGICYLLLVKIISINTPFIAQETDKLQQLYTIFPVKTTKMVLGRFIYLALLYLVVSFLEVILIMYLYNINEITSRTIIIMCFSEIITAIVLFIQYPVNYKIDFNDNKMILNLISIIPAMSMMVFPGLLIDGSLFGARLDNILSIVKDNINFFTTISIFILIIAGYISYYISCKICKNKEV